MTQRAREELEAITRELADDDPALAERLSKIAKVLKNDVSVRASDPSDYISTGDAAAQLGVSINTIKKWVRTGVIRDFWTMPGSGYVKIARTEVARIRTAKPNVAED